MLHLLATSPKPRYHHLYYDIIDMHHFVEVKSKMLHSINSLLHMIGVFPILHELEDDIHLHKDQYFMISLKFVSLSIQVWYWYHYMIWMMILYLLKRTSITIQCITWCPYLTTNDNIRRWTAWICGIQWAIWIVITLIITIYVYANHSPIMH